LDVLVRVCGQRHTEIEEVRGSREAAKKKEGAKSLGDIEALATEVIDCGYHLHRKLGPGLFESVYELLLADAISKRGLHVEQQKLVDIEFEGLQVPGAFKVDLLIENALIIELKSVERTAPVHIKQTLTYLRLMALPLGFVMNFGEARFMDGLKRVVNTLSDFPSSSRLRGKPLSPTREDQSR
jgi:GxxExxY protein